MLITGEGWDNYAKYGSDGKLIGLKPFAPKKAIKACVTELCMDFDWTDSELENFEFILEAPRKERTIQTLRKCQSKLSDFIDLLKRLKADTDILEKYINKYEARQKNLLKYEKKSA